MKKTILFIALAGQCFLVKAQQPVLFSTKSLAGAGIQQVNAQTSGGNISVVGTDAGNARIEVYVRSNRGNRNLSKEDIQDIIRQYYTLNITESNHTLTAVAKSKSIFGNSHHTVSISFRIYVSQAVSTKLKTSGGNIHLSGLSGTQNFVTSGGNLEIDHVGGTLDGETSGGNIHLSGSKGIIHLATSGGNIHVDRSNGKIKVVTSGGSIEGEQIHGELDAHTSGGGIQFSDLSCGLDAGTSGGNIQVSMTGVEKYVKLNTSGGNIDLRLPGSKGYDLKLSGSEVSCNSLTNFNGTAKKDKIEGKMNGGGIPVDADASGNIRLRVE